MADSTSRGSITLVLDPDEAGQRAAESSGQKLAELLNGWGRLKHLNEPTSRAVVHVQRAIDDLAEAIQARDAMGVDSQEQTAMRIMLWDYMVDLMLDDKPTEYSSATNAEELERALDIANTPLLEGPTRIDYAAIKRDIDIVTYIGERTELKRVGATYRGRCPLPDHAERTASLYVYPSNSSWYCFGCNRGGDVITFAQLLGIGARDIR